MLIFAANLGEGIAQPGSPTRTEQRGISTRWARQSFGATEEALQKLKRLGSCRASGRCKAICPELSSSMKMNKKKNPFTQRACIVPSLPQPTSHPHLARPFAATRVQDNLNTIPVAVVLMLDLPCLECLSQVALENSKPQRAKKNLVTDGLRHYLLYKRAVLIQKVLKAMYVRDLPKMQEGASAVGQ